MTAWPWFAIAVGAAGVAWIVRAAVITAARFLIRVARAGARHTTRIQEVA